MKEHIFKQKKHMSLGLLPSIVVYIAVMVCFFLGVARITQSDTLNERKLLEEALHRDIIHCYALEGMYPPSVEYLEEHYGLIYNPKKFIINYENIGSNIMPTVYVIER